MTKIEQLVLSVLEDLKSCKLTEDDLDSDLTKELRITSDDLTFVFVPNLESALGVKVPTNAWKNVYCGRDAAELLTTISRADGVSSRS